MKRNPSKKSAKIKTDKHGHTALGRDLIAGVKEMAAHMQGKIDLPTYEYHPPRTIAVASVRKQLGMSQNQFAHTFGLNVGTLRDWEQGRRKPDGMARILLAVIAQHPATVCDVLSRHQ